MTDRPPIPGADERARTIAARGPATLLPPGQQERVAPLLHHVHADATVTVLLPDGHPLAGEVTVVELVDLAPVPLREPARGLLWITGRLAALPEPDARARAVELAAEKPDPRLLDLGHGATMLTMEPLSMVVADPDGTHPLTPAAFAEAEPDPFCHQEAGWLRHLELSHTDVLHTLRRHLPADLRGGDLRPLGLDRLGLRLRVELIDGDHDVRLAFERPITTQRELSVELRRMVGCPFLAATPGGQP
ncbi:DUF2470 domain-containing protein [Actinophytocola gossypii]|uniref:DUF2470 domain-containing protein n=1 Tax=Actinophytocola gossypii TaxID=2812003 RepID=A0ABT2JFI3_9PSEU|nr:DUF2470 domain-containing protein [Actinophytocola gossypii]MCT2586634.1 DUF2470 domain-containing protein [Actinophytocola gossypii]